VRKNLREIIDRARKIAVEMSDRWILDGYSWGDIDKIDADITKALTAQYKAGLLKAAEIADECEWYIGGQEHISANGEYVAEAIRQQAEGLK